MIFFLCCKKGKGPAIKTGDIQCTVQQLEGGKKRRDRHLSSELSCLLRQKTRLETRYIKKPRWPEIHLYLLPAVQKKRKKGSEAAERRGFSCGSLLYLLLLYTAGGLEKNEKEDT